MPIERRQISNSINAGNFGRPGTPLGLARQGKGPDFGRMMKSLGVVADKFAGEEQADNEAAAGTAIREVLINTKGQSKEDRATAINGVRDKFDDQGFFLNAWTNENPAVKTIDKINGRAQALTTRGTINQLMQDSVGESLETRQELLLAAVQDAGKFTQGISDESYDTYLKDITNYALTTDDQLISQESIRVKTENQNKVYNNYVLEGEEVFNFYAGQDADAMNTDPAAFQAGQASLDGEEAQSDMKEIITKTGAEMYQDQLSMGSSKQEASQKVANYVHHLAKKYNRPEIITNGMDIKLSDGLTLKDVHGAKMDEAETAIGQAKVRKQASFKQQAEIQRKKEFKIQYDTTYIDNLTMIQRAKGSPDDNSLTQEALVSVRTQTEDLIATKANYKGNPDHFAKMLNMLNHNVADLETSLGDPMVEQQAIEMVAKGTMDGEWYLMNSNKIDDVTKSKVQAYLGNERKSATDNAAAQIKRIKLLEASAIEAPMDHAIDDYKAFTENSLTRLEIETLQDRGVVGDIITSKEIRDAGWQAVLNLDAAHYDKTKEAQAPPAERAKAYNEGAGAKLKEANEIKDKLRKREEPEEQAPTAPKEVEGSKLSPEAQSGFTKAVTGTDLGTITFDEAQALGDLPSEAFHTPKQELQARQTATTAIINNSPDMTIEAAVRLMIVDMDKAGEKFDPSNATHLSVLQSILEGGFARTVFRPNVAKGVSLAHTEHAGKTLGEFLSEEFDPRTAEHLIHPDQLGDINKLRAMLGATEQN